MGLRDHYCSMWMCEYNAYKSHVFWERKKSRTAPAFLSFCLVSSFVVELFWSNSPNKHHILFVFVFIILCPLYLLKEHAYRHGPQTNYTIESVTNFFSEMVDFPETEFQSLYYVHCQRRSKLLVSGLTETPSWNEIWIWNGFQEPKSDFGYSPVNNHFRIVEIISTT